MTRRHGFSGGHGGTAAWSMFSVWIRWLAKPKARATSAARWLKASAASFNSRVSSRLRAAWRARCPTPDWGKAWRFPVASAAYGLLMEVLQRLLTDCRQFSWGDVGANLLGACLSAWLLVCWFRRRGRAADRAVLVS